MDSYNYVLTELAAMDITKAVAYIAEELCNETAAKELYIHIKEAILNACQFPFMHEDCAIYYIQNDHIRRIVVDNYILIYKVIEEKKLIEVLRFKHYRTNISSINIG